MPKVKIDPTIPVRRLLDVEFTPMAGRPLLLDAVSPVEEPEAPRPAGLYVGGDGGSRGQRSRGPWMSPSLATHGSVAASCDYRPSGVAPVPAQFHDVKATIRWLRAHAQTAPATALARVTRRASTRP